MAKTIFDHTSERLTFYVENPDPEYPVRAEVKLKTVRIWETTSSWAEYSA